MLEKLPLGKGILGNKKLQALYQEVQELNQKVGTKAFALEVQGFDKKGNVEIFDELVDVSGQVSLEAALRIHAASQRLTDLYGTGEEFEAPTGKSFADFRLTIGGNLGAEGSASTGALKISAKGALSTGIDYRHVLPVSAQDKRRNAFKAVLGKSLPPQRLELRRGRPAETRRLADGEVHRLEATFNLDFRLAAEVGWDFALKASPRLFQDLPGADLEFSGKAAFSAALGLAIYERMYLAVGRSGDWARIRLQREHERRIGFSAMMALQARYDFGGGLATVLEHALDQSPMPRLLAAARAIVDPVANADWDAIQERLTGRLAEAVSDLLEDSGWKSWVSTTDKKKIDGLLATAAEIVDFYDNKVGPTVHSFWDQLLGKADLGPGSEVRQQLAKLAQLDSANLKIDDLFELPKEIGELDDLIETFSGKSLEEILLSSDGEIRKVLAKVAGVAKEAQKLFDLDQKVVKEIRGFAERTGIDSSIDFLRKLPKDTAALEGKISDRLRNLVERLAGKVWKRIDSKDLDDIRQWAQRAKGLLDGAEAFEAELLQKIRAVRGEVGFSVGLEISRISTATALLDVEVDLTREKEFRKNVQGALAEADVNRLLDELAKRVDADDGKGALPFRLRECVFTSRRVRTSAVATVLTFIGLSKLVTKRRGISRRVEESTLRVSQVGKKLRRAATYSGGFQRTEVAGKTTSDTAVWLEMQASDPQAVSSLEGRFGQEDSRTLRATYAREDDQSTAEELAAIGSQLERLGMEQVAGKSLADVPPQAETRLAVDFRLPGEAIARFCKAVSTEPEWNTFYLRAAKRWFNDRLVDRQLDGENLGDVLEAFIRTERFLANWRKGATAFGRAFTEANQGVELRFEVNGKTLLVKPVSFMSGNLTRFHRDFDPAGAIVSKRGQGFRGVGSLGSALSDLAQSRTPERYRKAAREFADGWKDATAYSTSWPTPTFGIWLLLERLAEPDMSSLLAQCTGVAFLRWKQFADWQGPVTWKLRPGGVEKPDLLT